MGWGRTLVALAIGAVERSRWRLRRRNELWGLNGFSPVCGWSDRHEKRFEWVGRREPKAVAKRKREILADGKKPLE